MQNNNKLFIIFSLYITLIFCGLIPGYTQDIPENISPHRTDRACLRCHKAANEQMLGAHATQISPNSNETVSCRNCHGNTQLDHRAGVNDVMKFQKTHFPAKPHSYSPIDQNSICLSCHQPEKLRAALWAHDVHIMKTACSNCHTLHPKQDPMKNISPERRIKLCVNCHTQQYERSHAADKTQE